jgi:hypothetical protein
MSESSSKTTTDLETIRQWAEEREGKPSRVRGTEDNEGGGVLRINFPGYGGEDTLEEISWEEWYETFCERNLAFLYQDHTAGGKESRFFKLIANSEEGGNDKGGKAKHGKDNEKDKHAKDKPAKKDEKAKKK